MIYQLIGRKYAIAKLIWSIWKLCGWTGKHLTACCQQLLRADIRKAQFIKCCGHIQTVKPLGVTQDILTRSALMDFHGQYGIGYLSPMQPTVRHLRLPAFADS